MLTIEERDVVVKSMKKYPAGVNGESWGSSDEFSYNSGRSYLSFDVQKFSDAVLIEGG